MRQRAMQVELTMALEDEDDVREAITAHLPGSTDDHYLYVIECRRRYKGSRTSMETDHDVRRRAADLKRYENLPWLDDCLDAHTLVYVGQTSNLPRRLYQHMWEHHEHGRAALFTKLFPPYVLRDARPVRDREQAEAEEKRLRTILNRQFADRKFFAYSDLGDGERWLSSFE